MVTVSRLLLKSNTAFAI